MEKLTPLADGVTVVPMKKELATVTLDIISKVKDDIVPLLPDTIVCLLYKDYIAITSATSLLACADLDRLESIVR